MATSLESITWKIWTVHGFTFVDKIGEGRQRNELAGGEEVAVGFQPVERWREPAWVLGHGDFWLPLGLRGKGNGFHFRCRREIDPTAFTLGNDGHQSRAHALRFAFFLDVVAGLEAGTRHARKPALVLATVLRAEKLR